METNNLKNVQKELIAEILQRKEDKIIEESNAELLIELIKKSDTTAKAIAIAELGTTYRKTGFHFDKRLERIGSDIKFLKKNEDLSFVNDENNLTHKLIIGDNYDALLNLLITHKSLVDIIYIDPPYGSDSMGKFAETNYSNAITRDNLLSMLYPRLMLAQKLLSNNGIIFCSIDDRNQSYVKCLMDDIFGEKNFICNMPRYTSAGEKTSKFNLNVNSDYVLCYCKDVDVFVEDEMIIGKEKTFEEYANPDNDPNGPWKKDGILLKIDTGRYGYARYGITNPYTGVTYYPPVYYNEKDRRQWHYVEETFNKKVAEGKVIFLKEEPKTGYGFYIKKYLSENTKTTQNLASNCLMDKEYANSNGTKTLKEIFVNSPFVYAKPVSLIKKLISIINKKDAIVLDFFAGSGTTGQAVLELNREDGGSRQFILCTNNEETEKTPNGIAYDVTSKRLKRIMCGECYDGNTKFEWNKSNTPFKNNLTVYEISVVNNAEQKNGLTPIDVIDETCYGLKRFDTNRRDRRNLLWTKSF